MAGPMTGFLDLLLKDETLEALIGTDAAVTAMLSVELALAKATCACGLIGEDAAKEIATSGHGFKPDLAKLNEATLKDGRMELPQGPGLGIELNDDLVQRLRVD